MIGRRYRLLLRCLHRREHLFNALRCLFLSRVLGYLYLRPRRLRLRPRRLRLNPRRLRLRPCHHRLCPRRHRILPGDALFLIEPLMLFEQFAHLLPRLFLEALAFLHGRCHEALCLSPRRLNLRLRRLNLRLRLCQRELRAVLGGAELPLELLSAILGGAELPLELLGHGAALRLPRRPELFECSFMLPGGSFALGLPVCFQGLPLPLLLLPLLFLLLPLLLLLLDHMLDPRSERCLTFGCHFCQCRDCRLMLGCHRCQCRLML